MIRILLADDEPVALERIGLAATCIPDAEVVATARNGRQAIELIRERKPDVAVLDIQMPGKDGFAVVEAIRSDDYLPEIIFVTAFHEHAVRAFETNAVDYLLKPVEFERFKEAMARAKAKLESRTVETRFSQLQKLIESLRDGTQRNGGSGRPTDIWVRTRNGLVRVLYDDVDLITAEGDYVLLHVGNSQYLHKDTMASLQARLDPAKFQRIHRSAIVNLSRTREVRRRSARALSLVLSNDSAVDVGPSFVESTLDALRARRWR